MVDGNSRALMEVMVLEIEIKQKRKYVPKTILYISINQSNSVLLPYFPKTLRVGRGTSNCATSTQYGLDCAVFLQAAKKQNQKPPIVPTISQPLLHQRLRHRKREHTPSKGNDSACHNDLLR